MNKGNLIKRLKGSQKVFQSFW